MADYEKMHRPWTTLESKEAVKERVAHCKEKLVVILFNLNEIRRDSVEYPLKYIRHKYEESSGTEFYKCPVLQTSDELAVEFSVKQVPTIIFYRNGTESARLVKPTEDILLKKLDELSKT